jgi:hypothetical protein
MIAGPACAATPSSTLPKTRARWPQNAPRRCELDEIKVKYYSVRKGKGYWLATKRMQAMGFPSSVPCGPHGPDARTIAEN